MARTNIVPCFVYKYDWSFPQPDSYLQYFGIAAALAQQANSRPKTLRELGIERILHRPILEWSANLGSYGMGGPGFFGLKVGAFRDFEIEWLVLTLWGADNWLLVDGQWLAANPNQNNVQRPLYSNFGGDLDWDDVTPVLVGATLTDIVVRDDSSRFTLHSPNGAHSLEIPQDTTLLPKYGGSGEPHVWNKDESQSDAWVVIAGDAELFC